MTSNKVEVLHSNKYYNSMRRGNQINCIVFIGKLRANKKFYIQFIKLSVCCGKMIMMDASDKIYKMDTFHNFIRKKKNPEMILFCVHFLFHLNVFLIQNTTSTQEEEE